MANIIKEHNNKLTNTKVQQQLACNCRVKSDCPLNCDCRKESIVYKCTACTIWQLKKVYLGLTEREFKTRYCKHSKSFRTKSYPKSTHCIIKLCLGSQNWTKLNTKFKLRNSSISTSILKYNQTMNVMPIWKNFNCHLPKPRRDFKQKIWICFKMPKREQVFIEKL